MSDLLRQILKASQAAGQNPRRSAENSDPIRDLLGGILGGRSAPSSRQPTPQQNGLDIGDLIGLVIGGNASRGEPHHNGMGDLIETVLGGGGSVSSASINPLAKILAERLNISPQIAQAIVAFFMAQMMKRFFGQREQGTQPSINENDRTQPAEDYQTQPDDGSLDLDDLLDIMGDGSALQSRFNNSGMATQLAQQTGLPKDKANEALQEVVKIIGQQRIKPRPVTTKNVNLKDLLDTW